jgi:4-aminobutyrate--pyruvate transaminase
LEGALLIDHGRGIYIYDDQGREYIEGLAGLWSVALGFSEQRLVDAATRQLSRLPFYHLFGNKAHDPSIRLSEKLVAMTPERLQKVFFTNSGSEANDTVLKLIWYFNNAIGRPEKKKIVSRQRAYHGVTIGAGSLTDLPANRQDFDLPVSERFRHSLCPHFWRYGNPGESEDAFSRRMAAELESLILREGAETVAAFIGEPIMGAGGVITPPENYWKYIQAVCRKHDVLIVVDEIITGFGRTGEMFASDLFRIDADIMVLSKQLTSSYQPLAAVLLSDDMYQAIADNTARIGTLGHGFTTSGHPVATAVALENIQIIEERGLVSHAHEVGLILQQELRRVLGENPIVGEIRGVGLIAGVEMVADRKSKRPFDPVGSIGAEIAKRCQEHGLITRAIGDTIALCPPLIITEDEVRQLVSRLGSALRDVRQRQSLAEASA